MITFQATMSRVSFLKDGSLSVGFITQEMSAEDKISLGECMNDFGTVSFSELDHKEVVEYKGKDISGKTASQKLRLAMFSSGLYEGEFKSWYENQMEFLINLYQGRVTHAELMSFIEDLGFPVKNRQDRTVLSVEGMCPECQSQVVNGVCQSYICKGRLL